jgi:hypothetical protein
MRSSVVATKTGDGVDASDAAPDVRRPFLWAYGNSAGDIPLLSAADIGVDAGRLNRMGRLRRFIRLADLEALRAEPTHQHQDHKRVV